MTDAKPPDDSRARIEELTRQLAESQERCRRAERSAEGVEDAHGARKAAERNHAEVCALHQHQWEDAYAEAGYFRRLVEEMWAAGVKLAGELAELKGESAEALVAAETAADKRALALAFEAQIERGMRRR